MWNGVSDWSLDNTDLGCIHYNSPETSVGTKKCVRKGKMQRWCPGICISNH